MTLRDKEMLSWLTKRSQEYLAEHVQYIGLLDEGKRPLANLPRQPIDWAHAELEGTRLSAPDVCWVVPAMYVPRYFAFYDRPTGGRLIDWEEVRDLVPEEIWSRAYEYQTHPLFTMS